MIFIKYIGIILIFSTSYYIGNLYSKKYVNRVNDLEEMKNGLNMFKNKISFTYETIPKVFQEISMNLKNNISKIFQDACTFMDENVAGSAWEKSLKQNLSNTGFNDKDFEKLKELSKMLGDTFIEGQVNSIDMTIDLLNSQIINAKEEKKKNEKLCKTIGASIGLTIAIILI